MFYLLTVLIGIIGGAMMYQNRYPESRKRTQPIMAKSTAPDHAVVVTLVEYQENEETYSRAGANALSINGERWTNSVVQHNRGKLG